MKFLWTDLPLAHNNQEHICAWNCPLQCWSLLHSKRECWRTIKQPLGSKTCSGRRDHTTKLGMTSTYIFVPLLWQGQSIMEKLNVSNWWSTQSSCLISRSRDLPIQTCDIWYHYHANTWIRVNHKVKKKPKRASYHSMFADHLKYHKQSYLKHVTPLGRLANITGMVQKTFPCIFLCDFLFL